MSRVLVCDPGESTGWIFTIDGRVVAGGTVPKNHKDVYELLVSLGNLDTLVYETFQLYPGKAKSLSWNTFYTVEVIGILKLTAMLKEIELIGYAPSVKKFAGGLDQEWSDFLDRGNPGVIPDVSCPVTEHTRDAYKLWKYFKLMNRERYSQKEF